MHGVSTSRDKILAVLTIVLAIGTSLVAIFSNISDYFCKIWWENIDCPDLCTTITVFQFSRNVVGGNELCLLELSRNQIMLICFEYNSKLIKLQEGSLYCCIQWIIYVFLYLNFRLEVIGYFPKSWHSNYSPAIPTVWMTVRFTVLAGEFFKKKS